MQHFRNYYNSEASMIGSSFPRTFLSQTYKNSFSKPRSTEEIKLLAAKKHSEAEKRRRMRINGQYDTLRNILPNIIKVSGIMKIIADTIINNIYDWSYNRSYIDAFYEISLIA